MVRKRTETPLDKTMKVMATGRLFQSHGMAAIAASEYEDLEAFTSDLIEVTENLMAVRNIVSAVTELNVSAENALLPHITQDQIDKWHEAG